MTVSIGSGGMEMPSTQQPPVAVREKYERLEGKWTGLNGQVRRLQELVLELRRDLRENNRRAAEHRNPPEGYALRRDDLERKIDLAERELAESQAADEPLGHLLVAMREHLMANG